MLRNLTIEEFVEQTASGSPTPGGGSVAALIGSIGSALNVMVYNLTEGKKVYKEFEPALRDEVDSSAKKLTKLYKELLVEMQNDTTAFDSVMDAFKLPKETEEEKEIRKKAISDAGVVGATTPMENGYRNKRVLEIANILKGNTNPATNSDFEVGMDLAKIGIKGCIMNIEANTPIIKDEEELKKFDHAIEELQSILN